MADESHSNQDSGGEEEIFMAPADLESPSTASTHVPMPSNSKNTMSTLSKPSTSSGNNANESLEVEYKIQVQCSQHRLIEADHQHVQNLSVQLINLARINSKIHSLKELWKTFSNGHCNLASIYSPALLTHDYFKNEIYEKTYLMYSAALEQLYDLQAQLSTTTEPAHPPHIEPSQVSSINLPKLNLPSFDGQYTQWKSFKDLFTTMIINTALTNAEKLQYLKLCLKGDAEQFTINLSISNDSFQDAWVALTKRYENKRILMSTHIDKLMSLPACSRTSSSLNKLVIAVTQSLDALRNFGSPVEHWDHLLIYFITSKLDGKTRESWHMQLGSTHEFPPLQQLLDHINDTAQALEQLEASNAQTTQFHLKKSSYLQSKTHVTLTQPDRNSSVRSASHYPCDHCQGSHYIVSCPTFRQSTPEERLIIVKQQRLCYNCLGHHSLVACRNGKRCNLCSAHHHTLLHCNEGATSTQ